MTETSTDILSDVATVISGYAFKSKEFGDEGVPVIKIGNIRIGLVELDSVQRVNPEYLEALDPKFQVRSGDILISLTGSHVTQPNSVVGRVARMSGHMPVCLLNQRAGKVIVTDTSRCDPGYLYWHLITEKIRASIAAMAQGAASQANVSPRQIGQLPINLPALPTQRRIANVLFAYENLIENNTRRIAIFEKIARRLYEEWFVRYRFPGHEGVKMIDSDSGLIPEDWDLGTLGQLVTAVKEPYVEAVHGNFPLIDLSRIPRRSSAIREFGDADDLKTSRIVCNSGDILFGSIRPYLHKVLRSPVEAVTNISVHVLRSIDTKEGAYEWMVLFSDETVAWAVQHSSGLKMPTIPWPVLTKMPVIIPTSDLREHFQQNIGTIAELIGVLVVKNTNLRTQRDILLPKLISGEIHVSEIGEQMAEAAAE